MYKIVNVVGNEVTFSHNELLTIPQFQALVESKDNWKQYFLFIWFSCDWESPFVQDGLGDKLCIHNAAVESKLEDELVLDDVLQSAMTKYKSLQNTGSLALLNSLLKGFNTVNKTVNILNDSMIQTIEKIQSYSSPQAGSEKELFQLGEVEESGYNPLDAQASKDNVKELMIGISQLTDIAKKVPDMIENLENLKKKVATEQSEQKGKAGGGKVGERELPDYLSRLEKHGTNGKGYEVKIKGTLNLENDSVILKKIANAESDVRGEEN